MSLYVTTRMKCYELILLAGYFHLAVSTSPSQSRFLTGPKIILRKFKGNTTILINNCTYESYSNQSDYVYVKPVSSLQKKKSSTYSELLVSKVQKIIYKVPDYIVDSYEYSSRFYECGMRNENVTSDTTEIDFQIQAPHFRRHPREKGSESIQGCEFWSMFTKGFDAYWMKNGEFFKTAELDYPVAGNFSIMVFKDLKFPALSPEDAGLYSCSVNVPSMNLLINSTEVNISAISRTEFEIVMDEKWQPDLSNTTSNVYKRLEKDLTKKIEKLLTHKNMSARLQFVSNRTNKVAATILLLKINVIETQRLEECGNVPSIEKLFESIQGFISVTGTSLDCCVGEKKGNIKFKGVYVFNDTMVGSNVSIPCVYQREEKPTQFLHRICRLNGTHPQWSKTLKSACRAKSNVTEGLLTLLENTKCLDTKKNPSCISMLEVANNLTSIIVKPSDITTKHDVWLTSFIISRIIRKNNFTANTSDRIKTIGDVREITKGVVQTMDVLAESDRKILAEARKKTKKPIILKTFEEFVGKVGDFVKESNASVTIAGKNIAFRTMFVEPSNLTLTAFQGNKNVSIGYEKNNISDTLCNNTIASTSNDIKTALVISQIPKEAFRNKSDVISFLLYKDDRLFQTSDEIKGEGRPLLYGCILALTIGKVVHTKKHDVNLERPVRFTFKKTFKKKDYQFNAHTKTTNICSFWKYRSQDNELGGKWMNTGCRRVSENPTDVFCECDHLTNFAVLLDVSQTKPTNAVLTFVTWIGCGISFVGLLMTAITYIIFPKLRKKLAPKILLCLVLSLMALIILFLIGADRTILMTSNFWCRIIAGSIQYFQLSIFLWMMVEGINIYRKLIKILDTGSDGHFFKISVVLAWGIPLVIVILTMFIAPHSVMNEKFCVITGDGFYYGILLPLCTILVINIIILVRVLLSKQLKQIVSKKKQGKVRMNVKIAFSCSILMGITWVFGLFTFKETGEVFQWLFTVFNSLQGFFIFIFHIVKSKDAITTWKSLMKPEYYKEKITSNILETFRDKIELSTINKGYDMSTLNKRQSIKTISGRLAVI